MKMEVTVNTETVLFGEQLEAVNAKNRKSDF